MKTKCYKIYCHINLINGKKYVGQTKQKLEKRWRTNGVGYSPRKKNGKISSETYFWKAIKKYGWNKFEHKLLLDNLTAKEANYWEKYYIAKWDLTNPKKGYNCTEGGSSFKISEKTRKKLSESHKGLKMSEETKDKLRQINKKRIGSKNPMFGKGKKVICLETKEIFNSCKIAEDTKNIHRGSVGAVCRGGRKTCGGLHFVFLEDYDENKQYDLSSQKQKIICKNTGEIFDSITEAKIKLNINNSHISDVCRGKLHSIKGYVFEYYVDK